MLEIIGPRHKELLELLLRDKSGLTVEDFSNSLGITRNAIRQHLATLETHSLVTKSITRPSGGRPEQLYVLTEKGHNLFPRQYSWFAQLLIQTLEGDQGKQHLGDRLAAMGAKVAESLLAGEGAAQSFPVKIVKLTEIMEDLGYKINRDAKPGDAKKPVIEADNCIFHDLAKQQPDICRFDLALLSTFTNSQVTHEECMAKGGGVCRFAFSHKSTT